MAAMHPIHNRGRFATTSTITTATTTTTEISPFLSILQKLDPKEVQRFIDMVHDCHRFPNITHSQLVPGQLFNESGTWCSRIYDGFACWDPAPAGTIVTQNCPAIVIGFNTQNSAFKHFRDQTQRGHNQRDQLGTTRLWVSSKSCSADGSWSVLNGTNKAWTDYTSCIDFEDLKFRASVNLIYVSGYMVSLIALLISLAIFLFFRNLQCTRIRIHMNLFTALTLNNILWILWYKLVVNEVSVFQNNMTWCQILHIIVHYFMVTTYFWMFCEALHLHISLVVVFVKDKVALQWFKAIGWGVSLIVVLAYAIVRYFYGNTERCWMETSNTFLIITVPVVISLLSSFVILVNVVRILISKMNLGPVPNIFVAAKKTARAALLLMPLFGVHYLLMPLRPIRGSPLEGVYEVVSAIIISLQGLCVSILFCFTNLEITTAIKAHWARIFNRNLRSDDIPMTGFTAGESMNT